MVKTKVEKQIDRQSWLPVTAILALVLSLMLFLFRFFSRTFLTVDEYLRYWGIDRGAPDALAFLLMLVYISLGFFILTQARNDLQNENAPLSFLAWTHGLSMSLVIAGLIYVNQIWNTYFIVDPPSNNLGRRAWCNEMVRDEFNEYFRRFIDYRFWDLSYACASPYPPRDYPRLVRFKKRPTATEISTFQISRVRKNRTVSSVNNQYREVKLTFLPLMDETSAPVAKSQLRTEALCKIAVPRDVEFVEMLRGLVLPYSWGRFDNHNVRLKITGLEAAPLFVDMKGNITGDYGRRTGALHPEAFRRLSFLLEYAALKQWRNYVWFAPGETHSDACYPLYYMHE